MRQPGLNIKRARGFLLPVAILVVVVIAVAIAALGNMTSADIRASSTHAQSVQAFYLAESGLEVEQRRWAQNLDWYRSATDPNPNPAVARTLGAGSFTVYANLPATLLKATLSAAATTITAYSTDRFPASGTLQIGEDLTAGAEFATYTNIVGNTFTGVARGQTAGTVTSTAGAHSRSDVVYPVTTLVDILPGNCNTTAFRIANHPKFLTAGTLVIEDPVNGDEEITYTGSFVASGNMTLTGVTRGGCGANADPADGPFSHPVGQPITPLRIGDSADYEVEMVSTGTVASDTRYARRTAQR